MNYTYPSAFNLKSAIANARAYAAANAQDSAHDGICAALAILDSGAKKPCCRGCDVPEGETHVEFCS